MTDEQLTNLLQLQLRNAIASKEAAIAKANRDTAKGGWTTDWSLEINFYENLIQALITANKYR